MQESRTSAGYPFSMSSCFILSSSGLNLVLEQKIFVGFLKSGLLNNTAKPGVYFRYVDDSLSSLVPSWIVTIFKKN